MGCAWSLHVSVWTCPSVQAEPEHNKLRSQFAVDDGQPAPSSFQRCGQQSLQLLAFNFWPLILFGPKFSHVPVVSCPSPHCLSEEEPEADVRGSVDDYPKEEAGIKSHTGLDWMDKGPVNPMSILQQQQNCHIFLFHIYMCKEQQPKAGWSQSPSQPNPTQCSRAAQHLP